jgi:hypothetical protein
VPGLPKLYSRWPESPSCVYVIWSYQKPYDGNEVGLRKDGSLERPDTAVSANALLLDIRKTIPAQVMKAYG